MGTRSMRRTASTEKYSKQRRFDEQEDGKILTAQPVSASYTVSCVTNGHDDYCPKAEPPSRHSESATDSLGRRTQMRVNLKQNGKNKQSPDRANGFLTSSRKALPETQHIYEGSNDYKKNRNVNVSKVRFEESWEDNPGKKSEYKVREASGLSVCSREELPGHKRSETQQIFNGDHTDNLESKENTAINLNTSSKVERPIKDKQVKALLNAQPIVQDKPTYSKTNEHKESMVYIKDNITSKRDVPSRLDIGTPQGRSEISRNDESKPLGLRQLIKIHEIQIAEVAKSAASMKRPMPGKAHEGRLVKVKIVPEIETKQSHVKQNAAKVTFAGNKSSSHIANVFPRKTQGVEVRSNVVEPVNGKEELNIKNDSSVLKARATVKPKRHTVELRTKSHIQEDQKWKRHTAIGLVGFDYQEREVPHGDWSPREKGSKKCFTSDSPIEPEKRFVDERITKSDVTDLKKSTSVSKEMSDIWKDSGKESNVLDKDLEMNEIPPERPPLPENFYSSTEEVLARPPPPVYHDNFEKADCKSNVEYGPKIDFKPSVEYIKASPLRGPLCSMPLSSSLPAIHVSTAIVKGDDANVPEQEIIQEKDHVLGKTRTTREMYEERLARINLVPLDISERHLTNREMVNSLCSSLESFNWDTSCNLHNLNKNEYLDRLKACTKQLKVLTKQKEDLEKHFELERRDWKRKYEEQQKVANAYQKLEDRYRRQVQELQEALKLCRCTDMDTRKALFLGQSWKRKDPYVLTTQTQSILDETEEWLKAQSTRSDVTYNSENISNVRIPNGHSPRDSLTDTMGLGTKWAMDYKDIVLATGIDQDNGTSV